MLLLCIRFTYPQTQFWQQTAGPYAGPINVLVTNHHGDIFAGTDIGGVYRSSNDGANWTAVNNGLPSLYIRALAIDSSGNIFVGTQGAGVLRSSNSGGSWSQTSLTTIWTIRSIAAHPSGHVLAGTSGGGAFRSTDEGGTWTPVNNGLSDDYVRSFAINSSGHVFAGTGIVGVFRSQDEGESWSITGLISSWDFRALAIDARDHIFAGGWGGGVFRSTDNGAAWMQVNKGLADTVIEFLAVNSSSHVFAATRSRGVFRTTDNGQNWEPINNGLTDLDVRSLAINADGYIFAGTASSGVFRSVKPTTSVKTESKDNPNRLFLDQNYPNPFNTLTNISFRIPARDPKSSNFAHISLKVYDQLGREVTTLVSKELEPGSYSTMFNARALASGVYFYRLQTAKFRESRKLMLVK